MSRLLIDPSMPTGKKFIGAPDLAVLLWFTAMCYSANNLSDGFVPESAMYGLVKARRREVDKALEHLTTVQPGCDNPSFYRRPGGWLIHGYDDPIYSNPTHEGVTTLQLQRKKSASSAGKASAKVRAEKFGTAQPPRPISEMTATRRRPSSTRRRPDGDQTATKPHLESSGQGTAPSRSVAAAASVQSPNDSPNDPPNESFGSPERFSAASVERPVPNDPERHSTALHSATTVMSGVEENVLTKHGDDAVYGANGAARPSLTTQAVRLSDWLLMNRGDHTYSTRAEQVRELATATQMLTLGLPFAAVIAKLEAYRKAMDPDDIASSLSYYYGRLQDEVHAELKQPRSHARTEGLTKLEPRVGGVKK